MFVLITTTSTIRDGYLFKEVNVDTFIDVSNIRPKIEELQLFKSVKKRDDQDQYDDNEEDETETLQNESLMKDIAEQLKDLGMRGKNACVYAN